MNALPQLVIDYGRLIPYLVGALITSLLLTPAVGRLATRLGALDLPTRMLRRHERNVDAHINDKITPRLGGLAMVAAITLALLSYPNFDNQLKFAVLAGVAVLTVVGALDDIYNLSAKTQFAAQFLAAGLVVVAGISITSIQVAGIFIDLNSSTIPIELFGEFIYYFIFPADIITIIWIVSITNFVNWASGIDALNGSISAIAAATILLISMKTGNIPLAVLSAIYLGAVLGVLPFNYPPSKIFYGFGEYINGFMLAVLAILSGSKLAISIIILGLPIIDACWVIMVRIAKNPGVWARPWTIMQVITRGDSKNHLHHRLLSMGFTWKMVLLLEICIMIVLCAIAFQFSGFRNEVVALVAAVALIILVFLLIILGQRRIHRLKQRRELEESLKPKVEVKIGTATSAEKFRY